MKEENLDILPPKFRTWCEFYKDVCKSLGDRLSHDEQMDDFKVEYSTYGHPDATASRHRTTIGFIKARVFDEMRKVIADNASISYDFVPDDAGYMAEKFISDLERMIL